MTRLIEWLITCLIALVLSSTFLHSGPSEIDAMRDGSAAAQDARQSAVADARFAKAAQRACGGENAAWTLLDDGSVQCATKRGFKTTVAKVVL